MSPEAVSLQALQLSPRSLPGQSHDIVNRVNNLLLSNRYEEVVQVRGGAHTCPMCFRVKRDMPITRGGESWKRGVWKIR